MDTYIDSLKPDWSTTSRWMRTYQSARDNNLASQAALQSLKKLLEERAAFLVGMDGGKEGEEMVREMGKLVGKIEGWIKGMKEVE
ncbi:MAG: hypothetical protein Q9186_006875 [Xanthomendoza sp. 1 TL-2023]